MVLNKNRYDRQIRVPQIGLMGQEKLAHSRILIVGCGALGTYAAEQLARTGVNHLLLIDPDKVEESNLQRQTLFTQKDIGLAKVEAAQRRLKEINPELHLQKRQENFDSALFEDLGPLDLVLDCTDNFLVRQLINRFCFYHKLPFVFASAAGTSGQVMALLPHTGPCLSCAFPNLTQLESNCETIGVITPLIPIISGIQISLALQILLQLDQVDWERMQIIEAWPTSISQFKVKKRANCEVCHPSHLENAHFKAEFSRSCGGVFQGTLSELPPDFINYCQRHQWQWQRNPLAVRVKFSSHEITAFHNGRLLFYHFDEPYAQQIFEEIKNL